MSYIYYYNIGTLYDESGSIIDRDDPNYETYFDLADKFGNAPEPVDVQAMAVDAVQHHLDEKAKTRNYDGILSLCTYATSSVPKFRAEGQAGVDWRDQCWAKCYEIMGDVQNGTRSIPTPEQVLSELPNIIW